MKVDICNINQQVCEMVTNGFSYLNKNINRQNYLSDDIINKPFYVSECWVFSTYLEIYELYLKYFSDKNNITALYDSLNPDNDDVIDFKLSTEQIYKKYFGYDVKEYVHAFIQDKILNKFDEDDLCAAPKMIIKSYFENI